MHVSLSFSVSEHVFLALTDGWMDCDCQFGSCVTSLSFSFSELLFRFHSVRAHVFLALTDGLIDQWIDAGWMDGWMDCDSLARVRVFLSFRLSLID